MDDNLIEEDYQQLAMDVVPMVRLLMILLFHYPWISKLNNIVFIVLFYLNLITYFMTYYAHAQHSDKGDQHQD